MFCMVIIVGCIYTVLRNVSLELRNVSLELRSVSLELRNLSLELRNVSLGTASTRGLGSGIPLRSRASVKRAPRSVRTETSIDQRSHRLATSEY
jgi:hypothetical protein